MTSFPLRKVTIFLFIFAGCWLFLRFLLPLFMPFILAGLLAFLAEPLVRGLTQRLHFPRGIASVTGIFIALLLTTFMVLGLCALLVRELGVFAEALPHLADTAVAGLNDLKVWLLEIVQKTPDGLRAMLESGIEKLFSGSDTLVDRFTSALLSFATVLIKGLPDSALSFGTWILASFMISGRLPQLRQWIVAHTPTPWKEQYLSHYRTLKKSVGGWVFAQSKLVGITFVILCVGLFLIRIPYPILWAGVICFVDILPILGTGTVLIPWSLICFLQGSSLQAVGLLGIYAIITLLRSILEPRFVGKELGLDPLITLFSIYAGYRLWGLLGMLFAPIFAVIVIQILLSKEKQG